MNIITKALIIGCFTLVFQTANAHSVYPWFRIFFPVVKIKHKHHHHGHRLRHHKVRRVYTSRPIVKKKIIYKTPIRKKVRLKRRLKNKKNWHNRKSRRLARKIRRRG